jgi:hydroxypyruvate isomerase
MSLATESLSRPADSGLRQSAADWCFFKNSDPATYYRELKRIGFYGVEMVDPSRFAHVREAGLELVNMSGPGMQQGLNSEDEHADILPKIRTAIASAAENRIPSVIVFSGNRRQIPDKQGIKACIKGLSELAPVARDAGVGLLFEVLNGFDHKDYQADFSDYAFEVISAVNSPSVRVLYDLYHMHRMGEDVAQKVISNLPLIGHLHVAGSPRRDYPGADQAIDYASVVRRIHAAGYRKLWGHEFLPAEGRSLEELARVHREFSGYARARVEERVEAEQNN